MLVQEREASACTCWPSIFDVPGSEDIHAYYVPVRQNRGGGDADDAFCSVRVFMSLSLAESSSTFCASNGESSCMWLCATVL